MIKASAIFIVPKFLAGSGNPLRVDRRPSNLREPAKAVRTFCDIVNAATDALYLRRGMQDDVMNRRNPKSGSCDGNLSSFFWWEGDTLVINILGKPSARRDAIGKPKGNQLKVSVTAAPKNGRATDHMVQFLADEFGVAAAAITVVYGRMNVNKQLRIIAPKNLPGVLQQSVLL